MNKDFTLFYDGLEDKNYLFIRVSNEDKILEYKMLISKEDAEIIRNMQQEIGKDDTKIFNPYGVIMIKEIER